MYQFPIKVSEKTKKSWNTFKKLTLSNKFTDLSTMKRLKTSKTFYCTGYKINILNCILLMNTFNNTATGYCFAALYCMVNGSIGLSLCRLLNTDFIIFVLKDGITVRWPWLLCKLNDGWEFEICMVILESDTLWNIL